MIWKIKQGCLVDSGKQVIQCCKFIIPADQLFNVMIGFGTVKAWFNGTTDGGPGNTAADKTYTGSTQGKVKKQMPHCSVNSVESMDYRCILEDRKERIL